MVQGSSPASRPAVHGASRAPGTDRSRPDGRTFIETARRAQIVAAAIDTIAQLGYGDASLARIAAAAGTSKGVLTYHFANREDLVRAVVDEVFGQAEAYMRPRIAIESTSRGALRAYIGANLAFMRDFRNHLVAMFEIVWNARDSGGFLLYDAGVVDASVGPLEALLRQGQADGEFGAFDAHAMAVAIRGAIDAVPPRLSSNPGFDLEAYAAMLATAFEGATRAHRNAAEPANPPTDG
jgi:TetR/AcrR family fatty acid metabolism transcriptional regulator